MSSMVDIIIILLIAGGVWYALSRLLPNIKQSFPAKTTPPPTTKAPPAPSGGGGGAPSGTTCPGGTACATSNGGSRNECDGVTAKSYEATWCGTFSGDDLSIKTFGPSHSGSSCCWCILSVSPDGAFGLRHEGPHPTTGDKTGTTAAIGKPSCVKAIVKPGSGGINLEGWGLVGGTWKKAFSYSGPCGMSKKSTTPASDQQVSFRCDGSLNTTCATVKPLDGGGGGGAAAPPAEDTGGGEAAPEPEDAGGGEDKPEAEDSGGEGGGEDAESNFARTRRDDIANTILSRT